MVDLIPYVNSLLESTGAQIELSYNDVDATLPLIVLTETENSADVIIDGKDAFSRISIQLDIYHYNHRQTRELVNTVNDIMTKAGFRRRLSPPASEDDIVRATVVYSCSVDEKSGRIYGGADSI
ncbi:MAG: hypothetical protein ACI4KR_00720 [Ruminiclostridium sp.]